MLVLSRGEAADGRRVTPLPSFVQGVAPRPPPFARRYSLRGPHLAPGRFFSPEPLRALPTGDIAVPVEYGNLAGILSRRRSGESAVDAWIG